MQRLIASLESKLGSGLTTGLRLTRSSPYRCLAGRPASELPMEIKTESFVCWTLNGKEIFSVGNAFYLLTVRA